MQTIFILFAACFAIAVSVMGMMMLNCCKDCGHSREEHIKSGCVECACKEWR